MSWLVLTGLWWRGVPNLFRRMEIELLVLRLTRARRAVENILLQNIKFAFEFALILNYLSMKLASVSTFA